MGRTNKGKQDGTGTFGGNGKAKNGRNKGNCK